MAFWENIIKENKDMPVEEDINSAEISTEDSISQSVVGISKILATKDANNKPPAIKINSQNKQEALLPSSGSLTKSSWQYFVGKGNNSSLIKGQLRNRFWLSRNSKEGA